MWSSHHLMPYSLSYTNYEKYLEFIHESTEGVYYIEIRELINLSVNYLF
jgi:hypothetical protein